MSARASSSARRDRQQQHRSRSAPPRPIAPVNPSADDDDDDVICLDGVSAERDRQLRDALHATISQGMNEATRKNYRNRIEKIILYARKNFEGYSSVGIRVLTPEEISDRTKFYFGKQEDLVYSRFNVEVLLFFYSDSDRRADGKLKSHDDLRKYRDCLLWGAKMAGERLPPGFYERTEVFLRAYKKRIAQQKKLGNVEVFATDPIPLAVYKLLLNGAIQQSNVFAWTWTILQWNCMARSVSIDCLGLHNLRLGIDSIIIKYDDSKADKAGERLSEKNIYANPQDWTQCPWLALGKSKCPPTAAVTTLLLTLLVFLFFFFVALFFFFLQVFILVSTRAYSLATNGCF